MIEYDNKDLVKKCLKGNQKAFEALVDNYQKTIFNIVYQMLHNFDDSEDVTQKVFIKVFESLRAFDPKFRFFNWIYRIAVNESINFLNQKKRLETLPENYIAQEKTPEEIYNELELSKKLENALMKIDPNYRILIVLRHFQDCSYKDIATILDIPEKTVKSRLYSARQLLKDALVKMGIITNA